MINSNELRAGNWILGEEIHLYNQNIHSNGYTKITAYGIYMLSENSELAAERYKPIPLTPEILEKCGFVYIEVQHNKIWKMPMIGFHSTMKLYVHDEKIYFSPFEWNWQTEVKYLHQLQNLFFALTGQELEIKL